ncbi:MAG: prepilin-type N-terminal cleavage/methylation domain-containing protein [Gammaproteobacteria bacterium]|nr:MAG: prepilin-type N-terminal cleavage/methylation domain-containing protein [Gammaproteobacteria bacterium]UTW42179.1 prepilin-type N-terminal cleavage/methylation domain-containing protein [bacterium SCSIO 12844]
MFLKHIYNHYIDNQNGFSLIEVLISICIISIAFIGVIKAQLMTIESSNQIQQLILKQTEKINKIELEWIKIDQNS